ncbi:SDR family NAD(P)-dependent oxidoreductase [bacterium]|nr:MAG: SDR family NAD(P)-dependent oxidoreductase [bacterium]
MRVLVIGASGLVGGYILKEARKKGYEVLGTCFSSTKEGLIQLDIRKKDEVFKVISDFNPDTVILPAAYASVDGCEENPELSYGINVVGTANVAEASRGRRFIYFSTDYIFDGKKGPYPEDAYPGPLSTYGLHKLIGEYEVLRRHDRPSIVRTAWVYGWGGKRLGFVLHVIKSAKEGRKFYAAVDEYGTPTYAGDIAERIFDVPPGIKNISGKTFVSRYEYALLVCEAFGLPVDVVVPVKADELPRKAKRPEKAGLIDPDGMELREGLGRMKNERNPPA